MALLYRKHSLYAKNIVVYSLNFSQFYNLAAVGSFFSLISLKT